MEGSDSSHSSRSYEDDDNDEPDHFDSAGGEAAGDRGHQGRVRTSREQRRLILAEFERSGVSAVEFARRSGLKYSTLAGWRHRHRRSHRPGRVRPVRLLEAVLPRAPVPSLTALPVLLPGGARLEIACAAQLPLAAALLRELEKPAAAC